MSALGGLLALSGSPPGPEDLATLSLGLSSLGPDGESLVLDPPVALVSRWSDLWSRGEDIANAPGHRTPHASSREDHSQDVALAWDGRLDHRRELVRRLGSDAPPGGASASDETLVLAAYEKWGISGFEHVVGDFALALWDRPRQRLVLARDPMGARPLYVFEHGGRLLWASTLASLFELAGETPAIDEDFVADYLTYHSLSAATPYRGVEALFPGTLTVVEDGQRRSHRFWTPQIDPDLARISGRECQERFRSALEAAIRCRLRTRTPVFAELSGGLDSSSIVVLADALLARGEAPAADLETVSYVYREAGTADETDYISVIEDHRGRRGHHLDELEAPILSAPEPGDFAELPSPSVLYADRYRLLGQRMADAGARVLLRGRGGDQVTWGVGTVPLELADAWSRLQLRRLWRLTGPWAQRTQRSYFDLLFESLTLALPWGWLRRRATSEGSLQLPSWFDTRFASRMGLQERLWGHDSRPTTRGFLPSQQRHWTMVQQAVASVAIGPHFAPETPGGQHHPVAVVHPYLDRPLVELCLSLPYGQKYEPGLSRKAQRMALLDRVPRAILDRYGKATTNEAFSRALARQWRWWSEIFSESRIAERGYIDRDRFAATLKDTRYGLATQGALLQRALSLELWLRHRESASRPTAARGSAESPLATTPSSPEAPSSSQDFSSSVRIRVGSGRRLPNAVER